jgi:lactate permease
MSSVISLSAFSPIIIGLLVILFLRKGAAIGAVVGIFVAVVLILLFNKYVIEVSDFYTMLSTSIVLTLSVLMVILPGLYLSVIMREQGLIEGLSNWVDAVQLDTAPKILILILGFLPAVESLTGFGVSLFLSIPIFIKLLDTDRAYRVSLLSMNIMPWGTLALATAIGAWLSGISVDQLGMATSITSSVVYPVLGLVSLFVVGGVAWVLRYGLLAIAMGMVLAVLLYVFSRSGMTESAGILSGSLVGIVSMFLLGGIRRGQLFTAREECYLSFAPFVPYLMVLGIIFATHVIDRVDHCLKTLLVLDTDRVSFGLLSSPGWALMIVSLFLYLSKPVNINHKLLIRRVEKTVGSIFAFIVLSQLMLESGMISAIGNILLDSIGGSNLLIAIMVSPLLGMISGFTTGSNVGGNALMMIIQQKFGDGLGEPLLFIALQNSSAGHAVFASLPIIILVKTIVREYAGEDGVSDHELLLFGLKVSISIYLALVVGALLLQNAPSLSLSQLWTGPSHCDEIV